MSTTFANEVEQGQRFEFGKNWQSFLTTLDQDRIQIAEQSLRTMLGVESLVGKSFLDIGSGSGLFSLCARRLGAKVTSFDYDPSSVACTVELRRRYFPEDADWRIERGSALDAEYLDTLGQFDVVYSWGVLHHTGNMWLGLENAATCTLPEGRLFIALYNDQGWRSRWWTKVKRLYCSGWFGRTIVKAIYIPYWTARICLTSLLRRKNGFAAYRATRGMSIYHDWIDWLGGYPFEVARVEEIFHFYRARGFNLLNLSTTDSLGNNEWVFFNSATVPPPLTNERSNPKATAGATQGTATI